ncbi:MAG: CotH kinase family protein [Bacteroidetes bacterium]|nr:CotH kinase family protein [Bacteroidota bacterium]
MDAYRINTFLCKKKNTKGGKLFVGPAWDYNIAFWNADYCEGYLTSGWQYQYNIICGTKGGDNVPFWWTKMLQDPTYKDMLKCRWTQLRQSTLHTDALLNQIDTMATLLNEAKDRHFAKWPVLGIALWANPLPVANDYVGEITNMKTYIQQRLLWLDVNMPGTCTGLAVAEKNNDTQQIKVYPNPFADKFSFTFNIAKPGKVHCEINDSAGKVLYSNLETYTTTGIQIFVVNNFSRGSGVYFLKIKTNEDVSTSRIVSGQL